MAASDTKLIERLQQRNADRANATDGGIHPRKPVPCVNKRDLLATEESLGFALPEAVRTLYLQIGNGGFGPQYGIVGTKGGAKLDGSTLETCYQQMLELENECSAWKWPSMLL
ncbi:MAG: SMI1/KNR4 family protein, partial [Rubripirellula sp.]